MAEPYYTTEAALETELGTTLDTPVAVALIQDAEDLIDELLGGRPVDETTGRKVVEADVDSWQWDKLERATLKLAAAIYSDATINSGAVYDSESGPDFSRSGRLTASTLAGVVGRRVMALLNQSGLRVLVGSASRNDGLAYGRSLAQITHDFYSSGVPRWSRRL